MTRLTSLTSMVLGLGVASVLAVGSQALASSGILDRNLVVNGNAEDGPGENSDSASTNVPGWTTSKSFAVLQYDTAGGFQMATDPGPADKGKNYFYGGPDNDISTATQPISLTGGASDISSGKVKYTFSAYLGGYATQKDYASVTAIFFGSHGSVLKKIVLGPVSQDARKGITGLYARSAVGLVPAGASSVTIKMVMIRHDGGDNDGSVDDISLVLHKKS